MLTYPHRPDQELASEEWQEMVALFRLPGDIVIHGPATRDEEFWSENAEFGLACASYACAFEASLDLVRNYLVNSNASFDIGLDRRAPFHLDAVMDQLASALVVNDESLAMRLCALEPARYKVAGVTFEPVVQREFDVWKAVVRGRRDEALALLQRAQTALATDKLPRMAREDSESTLSVLQVLLELDAAGFDAAVAKRALVFAKTYRNASARQEPNGLLDLRGLALAALPAVVD